MENVEVEVKLKIREPKKLLVWLRQNAKLLGTERQVDHYFDQPHQSFIFTDEKGRKRAYEYLRLRTDEKGTVLCFKRYHHEKELEKAAYFDEIETRVENPKNMRTILENLGFREMAIVDKTRKSYQYKNFQFDCDTVTDLGFFVEIEYKGKVKSPKDCLKEIYGLLTKIGLNEFEEINLGYVAMLWNKEN